MEGNSSHSRGSVATPSLVGRQKELSQLNRLLEQAVQYHTPQSVMVVGSQGVGKTTLVDHWLTQLREEHLDVRIFFTWAKRRDPSYSIFTRLLKQRFSLREGQQEQEVLDVIRPQVEEVLQDRRVAEVLHFLGTFLGVSVPDNPFLRAIEDAPAQHDQIARTVLLRFLEADAQMSPVVLVLGDLHQADEASVTLFRDLAEGLEGAPIVLVGTSRPELYVNLPEFSTMEAEHARIDLPLLTKEESEQQLRGLLANAEHLPQRLISTAVEMTGGNPLFMETLVRGLQDRDIIGLEGETLKVDEDKLEQADLPMSMEEAVQARIASLSPTERDVLEKASTLGSVFWLDALVCFSRLQQEVEEQPRSWMADVLTQTIKEVLEDLVQRDFLILLPDSNIAGAIEYAFKNNMERKLISSMVPPERQRQYHIFAAQWLETRLVERSEAQLEDLAGHYDKGGNRRRAAFCYVYAGDKARSRYANKQAAIFYRQGVKLLKLDDALSKIDALHNLGDVCSVLGHNEEALEHFTEMLHFAWLLDHRIKGASAHRRLGQVQGTLGEYERAMTHLENAKRLFQLAGDTMGVAATFDDVGKLAWLKGEYDQALEYHRQALNINRDNGRPQAIAVSLHSIGRVHQEAGAAKEAKECFVEALEIRQEIGDQLGVVDSLTNLGEVSRAQSEYAKAMELWNEALTLARDIGDRMDEAYLNIKLGETQLQLGEPQSAEEHIQAAVELSRDLGDRSLLAGLYLTMCEVKLALGDHEEAEKQAQRSHDIAESLGLKPQQGTAMRALAEVVASRELTPENRKRATELFRGAIEIFTELGNDMELAKAFAAFADYYDSCGMWQDADHFRHSADDIFNRLK